MAAEGGGSKLDSPQNDEVFGATAAEQTVANGAEITEDDFGTKDISHNASTTENSSTEDPEENESRPILSGWLNKCGNIGFVKTAKLLWFVFSDDTCKLYYYRSPQDLLPLGEIDIKHASFHFDANNQKPGLFEIRSDGKVYLLDAQGQHRMAFWLEELQKKRRLYSAHRKMISSDKMSWTLKQNHRKGSGLTGHGKGAPEDESLPSSSLVPRSASCDNLDGGGDGGGDSPSSSGLQSMSSSSLSKAGRWSLTNLQSEIRDVVSNMRAQISPASKVSPSPSQSSEGKEDWTFVDNGSEPSSHHTDPAPPHSAPSPPPQPASAPAPGNQSGTKLGGKFAKMFRSSKRSQSDSGTSAFGLFKDSSSGSKKTVYQPDVQTCYKCKVFQGDIISLREDLKAAEEETQANREIMKLMQKELDIMRVTMLTMKESEGKSEEEKDVMLRQKDKHVVELEHGLALVQEQKAVLEQQTKMNENSQKSLQDEIAMLQEMLMARDEAMVTLTRQISELENSPGDTSAPPVPQTPVFVTDTRELQALKDSVQAYQMQNNFLTKEIMELNELRKIDEKQEKELLINYANLDAMYCQTRSKYLFLLNEKQEPVRGGEETKSQEAVSQLLKEALETESDSGPAEDHEDARYPFLASHSTEYDRYGFLICANEEFETEDPLLAKASILQRQCDEINSRIKDVDETTSKHVKWENFMVGQSQSGKPLMRSPELKSLIRIGIPHEYKEHIWKGCINFYVAQTRDKLGPLYYKKDLGERIKNSKSNPAVKQIELDLLRTLPNNRHFDSIDSDGVPKLRRVLLSYSVHNPLIGYCQGLNRLAAIALLFLSEEESFWCLEALIEHILPKDYYTKTLAAAQADQRVLKELVAEKLPKLHSHFEHHDVDLSLYTFNWFLTIFVDNVRPETFLRCWDALLYEGSKVLFRFGLAFLKYSEEEILKLKEAPQIYRYMRMLGEKVTSIKKITQIAFYELNPFPMRVINSKRVHHMQMVREELRELDLIRQDFQSSHSPRRQEGYVSEDDLDLDEIVEEEEGEEEGEEEEEADAAMEHNS